MGKDPIEDFNHGQGDGIRVSSALGVHSAADVLALVQHLPTGEYFIDFGGGNTLTLQNAVAPVLLDFAVF